MFNFGTGLLDFVDSLKNNNRVKVEVDFVSGATVSKVSVDAADTTADFLTGKLTTTVADLTKTIVSPGAAETLNLALATTAVTPASYGSASSVATLTVDSKGRLTAASNTAIAVTSSAVTDFVEAAQDAIGAALLDTTSVDLAYNDAGNTISATVLPAGVDHNQLLNFVANKHIDHSAVSITAGTGLSGGGDITTTRTLNLANTAVTAASYGSATQVPNYTVDAQGRLTAAANTSIQIAESQVTSLVTDLGLKADKVTTISAGYGLVGGGSLAANRTFDVSLASTQVTSISSTTTTSSTDVLINSMTITPTAGTYWVLFTTTMQSNATSADISTSIYSAGAINSHSERTCSPQFTAGGLGGSPSIRIPIATNAVVTVNGSQAIEARWRISTGTATCVTRTLQILRLV